MEAVDFRKVEDDVARDFDPTFVESEMGDLRIDFGDYSMWLRSPDEAEGTLPRNMKAKMSKIFKKHKIQDYINYD